MKSLEEIRKEHLSSEMLEKQWCSIPKENFEWLLEQAKTLQKIADRWVEIETNGTYEEANDFYTFVQDTLSPEPLD